MSDPVDFTISRIKTPGQSNIMRFECKDGLRVLVTIDVSEPDYCAVRDKETVTAALTMRSLP